MPDTKLYITGNNHVASIFKRASNMIGALFIVVGIAGALLLILNFENALYFFIGILLILLSAINSPLPITLSHRIVGGCELPFRIMMSFPSNHLSSFFQVYYFPLSYQTGSSLGGVRS
ncbi:MAG: hypothetical protein G5Z42_02165 [Caldisphaeraceae archaeon]|nr:hypothetical protein [Caldisphaeraceae archaeon]MEB3691567.1 hypothetical protein [Caldisphaeraceae archaeon]MEB3797611.1 hypothetical protein [Caldisphaeraceae archaeon]